VSGNHHIAALVAEGRKGTPISAILGWTAAFPHLDCRNPAALTTGMISRDNPIYLDKPYYQRATLDKMGRGADGMAFVDILSCRSMRA
jgi:hypothetical protein